MENNYDVTILGGGLAGLTISIQLKMLKPDISILVLEKRNAAAEDAAHKVGESTVELGTHYLREVLDLKDYLDAHQLPKYGLRFFLTPQHKDDITKRVEMGPKDRLPVPSHQLDRGIFENYLVEHSTSLGNEIILGANVKDASISADGHQIEFIQDNQRVKIQSKWIVDASGRGSFLKRKLGFQKQEEHAVNAVWFRVKGEIDVDDWSDDTSWNSYLKPGHRRLGTIHLMDKGYWVWLIPLVSGNTSVGIVADPALHPFSTINRFEKAMDWLQKNEPQCYGILDAKRNDLLDFKVLKHYCHNSGKFFSSDRWGVTGESGAFLDPFYSPGTDFIAISNTILSDLIVSDLEGEDIQLSALIYEQIYSAFFDSWVPIYNNQYPLMGHTQVMTIKILWDWSVYWAVPTLLFTNHGFTNLKLLRELSSKPTSILRKLGCLNTLMQRVLRDWAPHDTETFTNRYLDIFDIGFMKDLHKGVEERFDTEGLINQLNKNMILLESVAGEIFRRVSAMVKGTESDMEVDPYAMNLNDSDDIDMEELRGIVSVGCDAKISEQLDVFWLYEKEMAV